MEESQEILEDEDFMEEAGEQVENSKVPPQLRPWQFKPGQSGNPSGRPKGTVSLKEYAKKYLQDLDEEGKLAFMEGLSKDVIWKMAEGNPKNDMDLNAKLTMAEVLKAIEDGNNNQNASSGDVNATEQAIGQALAITESIQDTGQEEKLDIIPPEQSSETLQPTQVVEKYNPQE